MLSRKNKTQIHIHVSADEQIVAQAIGATPDFVTAAVSTEDAAKVTDKARVLVDAGPDSGSRPLPVVILGRKVVEDHTLLALQIAYRGALLNRAGDELGTIFNARAAFRISAAGSRSEQVTLCADGEPICSARLGDVSFEGLGVIVTAKVARDVGLAADLVVELDLADGVLPIPGTVRHMERAEGGYRLGLQIGTVEGMAWTSTGEDRLRKFVAELQRTALERARAA